MLTPRGTGLSLCLFLTILSVLASCGTLEIRVERTPALLTAQATATGADATLSCDTSHAGEISASPNAEFAVVLEDASSYRAVVVAIPGSKCETLVWREPASFKGWTADSRFAVFQLRDQYGNADTVVFDTVLWTQQSLTGPWGDMSGRTRNGPVAIAPITARVLLGMGKIMLLPDTEQGTVLSTIDRNYVAVAAWSPDESRLAFVAYSSRHGEDSMLYLARGNGSELQPITDVDLNDVWSLSMAWTADGHFAILTTGNADYLVDPATGQVRITAATATPEPLPPLPKPTLTLVRGDNFAQVAVYVQSIAFSPTSDTLAVASNEWGIHLFGRDSLTDQAFLPASAQAYSVAYSPDGRLIAAGSIGGDVWIWQANDGQLLHTLHGHTGEVRQVGFSPDSHLLVTAGHDGLVRLWDVASDQSLNSLRADGGEVLTVVFSPDGNRLASGGFDGNVYVWQVSTGEIVRKLEGAPNERVRSLAFSPDGAALASASLRVNLWEVATGQLRLTIMPDPQTKWVCCVAFSPDGAWLAATSREHTVGLWNAADGTLQQTFEGHTEPVTSLAFSPDGRSLASGGLDGTIRIWPVNK